MGSATDIIKRYSVVTGDSVGYASFQSQDVYDKCIRELEEQGICVDSDGFEATVSDDDGHQIFLSIL